MIEFDSFEDIRDYLIPLKFKEYESNSIHRNVYKFFQKKYADDSGIKYFIDCCVWYWSMTDKIDCNFSIEFEGQYYQKGTHDAVNMTFIGWELNQVEKWLDEMFEKGFLEHYEIN